MPFCGNCGTKYSEGARFCDSCGAVLTAAGPASASVKHVPSSYPRKDAGLAALFACLAGIFLFGLGHLYVGKIGRGVILLVVGLIVKILLIGLLIFVIPIGALSVLSSPPAEAFGVALLVLILLGLLNLGLWIWQIYDTYRLAVMYNETLERTGKPPW
jgi:TM2 domain-containing membrane protein YozV